MGIAKLIEKLEMAEEPNCELDIEIALMTGYWPGGDIERSVRTHYTASVDAEHHDSISYYRPGDRGIARAP